MGFTKDDLEEFYRLGYHAGYTECAVNEPHGAPDEIADKFDGAYKRLRDEKKKELERAKLRDARFAPMKLPYCGGEID